MQDLRDGSLKTVDQKKVIQMMQARNLSARESLGLLTNIPPDAQGPTFHEGEILEIKGSKFRIIKLNSYRIILEPVRV